MRRLRLLAGLLGCLAVLAASLPTVALAWTPSTNSTPAQTAVSEPCGHCPDCQGEPCQPATADCMQACVASPQALGVANFSPPKMSTSETVRLPRLAALHGWSPPLDPFPPRS